MCSVIRESGADLELCYGAKSVVTYDIYKLLYCLELPHGLPEYTIGLLVQYLISHL